MNLLAAFIGALYLWTQPKQTEIKGFFVDVSYLSMPCGNRCQTYMVLMMIYHRAASEKPSLMLWCSEAYSEASASESLNS